MKIYSKAETDWQIQKTIDYQWGEGRWEGQNGGMGRRDTNYYIK